MFLFLAIITALVVAVAGTRMVQRRGYGAQGSAAVGILLGIGVLGGAVLLFVFLVGGMK